MNTINATWIAIDGRTTYTADRWCMTHDMLWSFCLGPDDKCVEVLEIREFAATGKDKT